MRFPIPLYALFYRHLATATTLPKLPSLTKIPSKYRPRVIQAAQQGVTEYLHYTRSIPFTVAEHISKNSLVSLSILISQVGVTASSQFSKSLRKFLRYHPINELEFFYESLGIDFDEVKTMLPAKRFFLSEDLGVLDAALELYDFGFPWNRLGMLYKEESCIFGKGRGELAAMLSGFKEYGFGNVQVVGICLAFPCALNGYLGCGIGNLFDDLKRVFLDFGLEGCVEGNVDAWYEVCRKIRVFYDLGCVKGKVGDLMGKSKHIFVDYPVEVLVQRAEYFCRLGISKEEVGLVILQKPEILDFDFEMRMILVEGLLRHFGISDQELESVARKYPHVLGKNRIANLPNVMKAMDLNIWFFAKIKDGNHRLFASYVLSNSDEHLDAEFKNSLERIQVSRTPIHTMSKLDFMREIGFGENALTIKVLSHLHGTSNELRERFDCLLCAGIKFSKLCLMISTTPKILSQQAEIVEKKLNYLCSEMESSIEDLEVFPAFLCFNLENRIRPRHRFHKWLAEKGIPSNKYSISSIVATSEKNFIARIYGIHPAAPKHYFERFSYKNPSNE